MQSEKKTLSDKASAKSIFFWNMMGSTCNAAFYMLLLMVVNRINGEVDGGVFSFGYAVAVLMWSIGSFETISYQVTDTAPLFSFGQYFGFKIVLCGLMMATSGVWLLLGARGIYENAVILLLCLFKALDAFSGVFYAQFQKYGRLDMGGRSLFFRVLLSMAAFTAVLLVTHDLIGGIVLSCVVEVVWIALYDMRLSARIVSLRPRFDLRAMGRLFVDCLPLFICSFLLIYLTNLPKYTIDAYYSAEVQSAFGALFMPASVINLMSLFIFRPLLTTMAFYWKDGRYTDFRKLIVRLFLAVLGLTAAAVVAAWLLGIPVLSRLYSVDLSPYVLALCIIMVGGGFSAGAVLAVNVLTVMRRQRLALVGYVLSGAVSAVIASALVKNFEMTGAAVLYTVSMLLVTVTFAVLIVVCMKNTTKGVPT